jgi:hypothetical protein
MSDPVSDLKHELLAAAERRQGHAPVPAARRRLGERLGRHRLLLSLATLAIATAGALLVTSTWNDSPGFLTRAQAALRPPAGTILHQKWEVTTTSKEFGCAVRHGPSEIWIDETPPHRYRVLLNGPPPLEATAVDRRALACTNWKVIELGGALDSGETLRFVPPRTLRVLSGRFSYPLDLVTDLRDAISAGTAHDEGRTQFAGRTVARIRVDPPSTCAEFPRCPRERFYWYVDPETFYPVASEGAGGLRRPDRPFLPLHVVVRYSAYEYLPRTAANLALANIRAQHPGATGP